MTQLKTPPIRRSGGEMDVFTGLLLAAFLVLTAGVFLMARKNISHSSEGSQQNGSVFKLVDKR